MKRLLTSLLISVAFFTSAGAAEAHVLEKDGPVHGVMHITPAHKPTAGEPAHFEFFMMNAKAKFDPKAYAYTLEISGEGMATATVPVTSKGSTLYADYTFPKQGENYTANLKGAINSTSSPAVGNQPNFTLDFDDIFVYPPGQHENPIENLLSDHIAHVILVAVIIVAFGAIVAWDTFVVRKRPVQLPPKENP